MAMAIGTAFGVIFFALVALVPILAVMTMLDEM